MVRAAGCVRAAASTISNGTMNASTMAPSGAGSNSRPWYVVDGNPNQVVGVFSSSLTL